MSKGRFPEKSSCSFRFCQNEGGREGPAQIFCPFFTNCIFWVNLGNGEGGGGPCPNLLAFKKGGGFEVILTKSKRTATFFSGNDPYDQAYTA